MHTYTVRKVKFFMGGDCPGYNAELCREGTPVAFVTNCGDGGPSNFDWYKRDLSEEKLLLSKLAGRTVKIIGENFPLDPELFVSELIVGHKREVAIKRRCVKSTCFRLKGQKEGDYMVLPVVYSAELGAGLHKSYGETLEVIYNDKFREAHNG